MHPLNMWFTLLVTLTYDFVFTKHCAEIFSQGAFLFFPCSQDIRENIKISISQKSKNNKK